MILAKEFLKQMTCRLLFHFSSKGGRPVNLVRSGCQLWSSQFRSWLRESQKCSCALNSLRGAQPQRFFTRRRRVMRGPGVGGGSNISNACRVHCKPESEMKICSSIASNALSACYYLLQWINRKIKKIKIFQYNSGNFTMLGERKTFIPYSWIFMKELFLKGAVKEKLPLLSAGGETEEGAGS